MKYLVLSLIWTSYCALHSYLISTSFTNFLSRKLKNFYSFYRLFYVLFSIFLLVVVIRFSSRMDNEIIITYEGSLEIVRNIFMYGSLLMFFWAFFFDYDSLSFFGIRQIMNFGKKVGSNSSEALKKTGLLGLTRHPMYLALVIYLWTQIFTLADIVVNIILTIYVLIGTKLEEKKLILEFGNVYKQYQQEIPMLIPFTKRKSWLHLKFH